jgi:hypothetical protein
MADLIDNAHINLLPTFQNTGIKLKLINSLYRGRFVVVNGKMVNNTGLEPLCIVEDNPTVTQRIITDLMKKEFTHEMIELRSRLLHQGFSNEAGALHIAQEVFGE